MTITQFIFAIMVSLSFFLLMVLFWLFEVMWIIRLLELYNLKLVPVLFISSIINNQNTNNSSRTVSTTTTLTHLTQDYHQLTILQETSPSKLSELTGLAVLHSPHIIVYETWFKDFSVVNIPNYNISRIDRKSHADTALNYCK